MEVIFFTNFSKRKNSTKQPIDSEGEVREVKLKGQCDLLNPMFFLTGVTGYVYCKAWGNYYFIHRVGYDIDGAEYVYCNIDFLATWRNSILGTRAYIIYASKNYNRWIRDDRTPIIIKDSEYEYSTSAIIFNDEPLFEASDNETVVLTTISKSFGIWSWVLSEQELQDIMAGIYLEEDLLDAILKEFGDINNSIVSVIRLPIRKSVLASSSDTAISFGSVSNGTENEYPWLDKRHVRCRGSIGIPATYLDYRFTEPYCKAKITLPFIGTFDISLADLAPDGGCDWMLDVDVMTGICTYTLYTGGGTNLPLKIIGTYSGSCGGRIPLANIQVQSPYGTARNMTSGLVTSGVAMASGHVAGGTAGGIASIVGGFFGFSQDTATVMGSYSGGRSEYASRFIQLTVEKYLTANEPDNLTEIEGRPVCKVDELTGYLNGYIQTKGFSIEISALDTVRDMINSAMDSGVYLE